MLRVLNGQCKTRVSDKTKVYLSKLTPIRTCFITQEVSDHLMKGLTGKQLLLYASKLKNAKILPPVDHEKIVQKWLTELDIFQTADTPVDRCSGGERKRIAAALELVSVDMPNLVIVDEIVSGLDTHSALVVIETLRKVATTHPLTIVTSIHQPTVQILNQFDQLYILARGGVCIFSGVPHQIKQHLEQVPELYNCHATPPIEILIKQSCAEWPNEITSRLNQLTEKSFENLENEQLFSQIYLTLDGVRTNRIRFSIHSVLQLSFRYFQYIRSYLWKEWLAYLLVSIAFGVNLRLLFSPDIIKPNGCVNIEDDLTSCRKTAKQVQDELLLLDNFVYVYYSTNIYMFVPLLYSTVTLFNELNVLKNEHRNGMCTI